jgi:hypothetical protein
MLLIISHNPLKIFVIPDKRSADPEPMPWTGVNQFQCKMRLAGIATVSVFGLHRTARSVGHRNGFRIGFAVRNDEVWG